jgi:hypothetical protein
LVDLINQAIYVALDAATLADQGSDRAWPVYQDALRRWQYVQQTVHALTGI